MMHNSHPEHQYPNDVPYGPESYEPFGYGQEKDLYQGPSDDMRDSEVDGPHELPELPDSPEGQAAGFSDYVHHDQEQQPEEGSPERQEDLGREEVGRQGEDPEGAAVVRNEPEEVSTDLRQEHDITAGESGADLGHVVMPPASGGVGISLDRFRDQLIQTTDEWVDGTQQDGHGNNFRYTLAMVHIPYEARSGPHYSIHVTQTTGLGDLDAQADLSEQVARFDVQTVDDEGRPIPGLDPQQFVEWSLDTFERHWGGDIHHADNTLSVGCAGYRQFQEVLAGDETNLLAAAESTDAARVFVDNGFEEVDYVCVDTSQDEDVIYVRFSKPGAREIDSQSVSDVVVPKDVPLVPKDKMVAITEYLGRPSVRNEGAPTSIPTTHGEPMPYTRRALLITNSDAAVYMKDLFSDEFEDGPIGGVRRRMHPDVVAGGLEGAFDGKNVLDIAAGEVTADHQLARMFPNATIVAVDRDYDEVRHVRPGQPGVQLTQSDWEDLREVPDAFFDTIISHLGVFMHGRGDRRLDAITRVARDGAVLRFPFSDVGLHGYGAMSVKLQQRGWDVTVRHNTVIAIKRDSVISQ